MLKILICAATKDDAEAIHRSAYSILQSARIRCELAFSSSAELIKERLAKSEKYDIFILDARSKECLELADYIRSDNTVSSIMFVNVQRNVNINRILRYRPSYVVFAFDENGAFANGIKHCCSEQASMRLFFTIKTKESIMRFDYTDIVFFESVQRIVCMYSTKKAVEFYAKLGDIADSLPENKFVRCHQSYIVNMDFVRQLDKSARLFCLSSGKEIAISKSYYANCVESFEHFASGVM